MFLVELVLQGIRGFQQLARVRFQGGFNFVAAGNEAGKTTAVDTIIRLLNPVNQPGKMETLVSRVVPDASRGALVVFTDDSSYYRVIQDFSKRAVNLSKFNPGTKDFTLMHKDWDSTAQFMAGLLPGVSEEDYARLFVFRRESCSGQSPQGVPASPAALPQAKALPSIPGGRSSGHEARLAELRDIMRKAEEAADAEYKLDAAKIRAGEIANKLKNMMDSGTHLAEVEAQIENLKVCEVLPENLPDLISNHEREQSEKMVKTGELAQDIEALTLQRDTIPTANLVMDKLFIGGVVVGGLALLSGLLPVDGSEIYFPIGVLAALLLIAAGWYNSSRKNAQRTTVQKEIEALVKERAEIEKKFQDSGAALMKFMKTTESKSVSELKEKAENYRRLVSDQYALKEQQRLMQGSVNREELQAELAKQQDEVAALDAAAKAVAHHAVDIYSVRQEIERLEAEHAPASPDLGFPGLDVGAGFAPPAQPAGSGMNILAEIAVASRVSGIEMETLVPAVESAAQRNLTTVSAGKYVKVEVGPDGLPVVHDKGGAKLAYGTLSHGTREMVCFCLRAGLVEAIAGKRRIPFVLDDPFTGLDPARQQAACQLLRSLGTKTQVILFTSNPALKASGETVLELK